MMLRSCCLRYFGQRNGDALLWHTDLKPHASGEFSIAVVQANSNLEDQSQVYTSPSATYVGVYDGHGGPEASRFVNRHLFLYLHRTNFQCFATAGDGSIVVGSIDGKIRLYSRTSMRLAKTAFPGLGSPITSVDVTYDGKWVLGTTDTYLILICTLFTDKDGRTKTGFSGRMGNKIPAPRLLKLTPVDAHLAGADNKFHAGHFSWQVKNSEHHCYQNQQGLKSCYCYKIVLKDESIIESRFMHDKFALGSSPEAPLVVATSMKVSSFSMSGKR